MLAISYMLSLLLDGIHYLYNRKIIISPYNYVNKTIIKI